MTNPSSTEAPAPAPAHPPGTAKRPWRGRLFWGAVVLLVPAAVWLFAGGGWGKDTREALPDPEPAADRDPNAVVVTVEPVTFRPVQRAVEAMGTLHGYEEVTLSAKVEGQVRRVLHDVAARVRPGDLLVEINPTDHELAVQQAERALEVELARLGLKEPPGGKFDEATVPTVVQALARMENAQARLARMRRLAATRVVSAEEMENATSDQRTAQAEHANQILIARSGLAMIRMKQSALAVAKQQLTDTQVRVPTPTLPVPGAAEGVTYCVSRRAVSEGTLVRPGTEVCKLVITQTLKLRVPVPERFSGEVRPGQKAEVTTAAFPRPFPGTVSRVNPAVETATRTFEVEIEVPNPTGELKPGNFARAAIHTRLDAEAATVPLSAVVRFAGVTKLFLAENGRAREVPVTLGVQTTDWVEIAAPALPRGGRVITTGQTALARDTPLAVRAPIQPASRQGVASSGRPAHGTAEEASR
jgi:RND family efflux transporter MFP subunit